jgi:hypothetical protein
MGSKIVVCSVSSGVETGIYLVHSFGYLVGISCEGQESFWSW